MKKHLLIFPVILLTGTLHARHLPTPPILTNPVLVYEKPGHGQYSAHQTYDLQLSQLLQPDGALDLTKGFKGSVNLAGFQMRTRPDGSPYFVEERAAPPDPNDNWYAFGGVCGVSGIVYALAVMGTEVYVGGSFTTAGEVVANSIARWDGASWSALGSGMESNVYTLAVMGTDLYAAGFFSIAGGIPVNNIARWDGANWSALGSGMNTTVNALLVIGTNLYAGGQFTNAGGVSAARVARWDGASWSALGTGLNNTVYSLAVMGTDLYVGGAFTSAGGSPASRIARWDGAGWSALGNGMNNIVNALTVIGSNLYAAGQFTTAGGITVNRIAQWDGAGWSALGSGMNNSVTGLAVIGTDLYASGVFTAAGGTAANYIARWDGAGWSALGSGMNNGFGALAVVGADLYAGGAFTTAGGITANKIARWDGANWNSVCTNADDKGMNAPVTSLAVIGTDLYAAGTFTTAGGTSANRIARWDGASWSALGTGLNNTVTSLAVIGTDVYAAGQFTIAGGVTVNRIARWDGVNWSALGSGLNNQVMALAVLGSDLYAGGFFTTAGAAPANYIARWDGATWSALGSGMNNTVFALAILGADLYAGGSFVSAGAAPAKYIARWDGANWSALGSGMNGSVNALAVMGTDLYAGGTFTSAGGALASRIARWDGAAWSALSSGVSGQVNALAAMGSNLYVGGFFTTAGAAPANNIARWDGATWSALGSGMTDYVSALAVVNTNLYAAGDFATAGGKLSTFVSRWNEEVPCLTLETAPPTVAIVNSNCDEACAASGGSIAAPTGTPCPLGSSLQYSTDNGATWSGAIPLYNQDGPAQSILTRCQCDTDGTMVSPASTAVATVPATCNQLICYADTDMDGYGDPNNSALFCNTCGSGYLSDNTDCNDNPGIGEVANPAVAEVCDGLDNNCNGTTDEGGGGTPPGWGEGNIGGATNTSSEYDCTSGSSSGTVFNINSQGYSGAPNGDLINSTYQQLCGDVTLTAHIVGAPSPGWAGIYIREDLSAGSKMTALKTNLSSFLRREVRNTAGGNKIITQSPLYAGNRWMRISRVGSIFTFYTSANGMVWTFYGSTTISMNSCLYLGLFAESINATTTVTASFDNVSIIGGAAPLAAVPNQGFVAQEPTLTHLSPSIAPAERGAKEGTPILYPNPTTGIITLDVLQTVENLEYVLFDAQGQHILGKHNTGNSKPEIIDLSQFPDGVYWIRIQVDNGTPVMQKIIKTGL